MCNVCNVCNVLTCMSKHYCTVCNASSIKFKRYCTVCNASPIKFKRYCTIWNNSLLLLNWCWCCEILQRILIARASYVHRTCILRIYTCAINYIHVFTLCEHVYVFNTLAYYEKCVSGIDNFKGEGGEAGIDNFKNGGWIRSRNRQLRGRGVAASWRQRESPWRRQSAPAWQMK